MIFRRDVALPVEHEILGVEADVPYVKESVLIQPHLHEGGLHAGEHVLHLAFVDIPRQFLPAGALHIIFRQLAVLQDRHTGLPRQALCDDLITHDSHTLIQIRQGQPSLPGAGIHLLAAHAPSGFP